MARHNVKASFQVAEFEGPDCIFNLESYIDAETAETRFFDPNGILASATLIRFLRYDPDRRCCNLHGCMLRSVRMSQRLHGRGPSLWKCPHRGCSVAWWGRETSTPADAETRVARRDLFAYIDGIANKRIKAQIIDAMPEPIGLLNRAECLALMGQKIESAPSDSAVRSPAPPVSNYRVLDFD